MGWAWPYLARKLLAVRAVGREERHPRTPDLPILVECDEVDLKRASLPKPIWTKAPP